MSDTPRHPNYKAAIPSLDMDTVASRHPQALESAVALNAAVGRRDLTAEVHAMEEFQKLPQTEQAVAAKIALSPGSPIAKEAKAITSLFGMAPVGGKPAKGMTP